MPQLLDLWKELGVGAILIAAFSIFVSRAQRLRDKRLAEAPEIRLKIRIDHVDKFWRQVDFLISNNLDEALVATEIVLTGIGLRERIAPAVWSGDPIDLPIRDDKRSGRAFLLEHEIKPYRAENKWRTVIPLFFKHPLSPNDTGHRLRLRLRIERKAPHRATWWFYFEAALPTVGSQINFKPRRIISPDRWSLGLI